MYNYTVNSPEEMMNLIDFSFLIKLVHLSREIAIITMFKESD